MIVDDSENERLKCLGVTDNNTDGDKTKTNDVDRLYAVSYTHLDVYKRQQKNQIIKKIKKTKDIGKIHKKKRRSGDDEEWTN